MFLNVSVAYLQVHDFGVFNAPWTQQQRAQAVNSPQSISCIDAHSFHIISYHIISHHISLQTAEENMAKIAFYSFRLQNSHN